MGFRSVMITEDIYLKIPQSFLGKYPYLTAQKREGETSLFAPVASTWEVKFYDAIEKTQIFIDLQEILKKQDMPALDVILLHECGGVTKVIIKQDSITALEPTGWKSVDYVEHNYCYGCSDKQTNAKDQPIS